MSLFRRVPHHFDAIAVVAIAIVLFVGSLVGLAGSVDSIARDRQETLIRNSLEGSVREAETRVIGITDWDDAVRNLDNRFDPLWADQNIGKYFLVTFGMAPSFVLDGDSHPLYRLEERRHPEWRDYSIFSEGASRLIAKLRARERARGPLRPPFHRAGGISPPIQEGGIFRTRAGTFLIIASLVQPDFGKALPRGSRSAILVICQKIDSVLLAVLGQRLAISDLRNTTAAYGGATAAIIDSNGHPALRLGWTPNRPGRDVVAVALLPILAGVLLLLALYFRGRATAAKLHKIIGEQRATRDAALNANRVKNEFLANMSHELRTPLNAILGFSEMLASDAFASHRAEYAEIIHRSGTQLLSLVNDLLDLSRIEAGKFAVRVETFDFDAMIEECMTAFAPHCAAKGIELLRRSEVLLPCLNADRRALQQILLNLLSNAVKFTPKGKQICIFVQTSMDGGIDFGVDDEGTGITEEDQAGVFERFGKGRHDLVRNQEGAGLGLPIVKGLVEAHGGTVSLFSRVGTGTRVTVHLPGSCVASQLALETAA